MFYYNHKSTNNFFRIGGSKGYPGLDGLFGLKGQKGSPGITGLVGRTVNNFDKDTN